jgi:hypothetical protein
VYIVLVLNNILTIYALDLASDNMLASNVGILTEMDSEFRFSTAGGMDEVTFTGVPDGHCEGF